jgi:hypothetical protein
MSTKKLPAVKKCSSAEAAAIAGGYDVASYLKKMAIPDKKIEDSLSRRAKLLRLTLEATFTDEETETAIQYFCLHGTLKGVLEHLYRIKTAPSYRRIRRFIVDHVVEHASQAQDNPDFFAAPHFPQSFPSHFTFTWACCASIQQLTYKTLMDLPETSQLLLDLENQTRAKREYAKLYAHDRSHDTANL